MGVVNHQIRIPLPLADAAIAMAAAPIAFVVRLDPALALGPYFSLTLGLALTSSLLTPSLFFLFGTYRVYWPYAAWPEVLRTSAAALASTIATAIILLPVVSRLSPLSIPRSVFALHFLLLLFGVACIRVIERSRLRAQQPHVA